MKLPLVPPRTEPVAAMASRLHTGWIAGGEQKFSLGAVPVVTTALYSTGMPVRGRRRLPRDRTLNRKCGPSSIHPRKCALPPPRRRGQDLCTDVVKNAILIGGELFPCYRNSLRLSTRNPPHRVLSGRAAFDFSVVESCGRLRRWSCSSPSV